MALNPKITDGKGGNPPDAAGSSWIEWTPDSTAEGYEITTPSGTKAQSYNPLLAKSKLGPVKQPITASVGVLDVTRRPPESASFPLAPPPPPPPPPPPAPTGFDPRTIGQVAPWNLDAQAAPVDPNSAALIQAWVARGNVRSPNVTTNRYSTAWAVGKASDPHYSVVVVKYGKRTITAVPIPAGTLPSPDSDGHLTIFDLEHQRQIAMWQAAFVNGVWQCGSASEKPLSQASAVGAGANATGIPNFALSVWPEEIAAGRIDHALGFSTVKAAPSFRYPAVHSDGAGLTDDLPEGAWLALPQNASINASWPAWVKVVHSALIRHGMFLMDQGGTLGIAGVNPVNGGVKWSDVGMGTGGSVGFPSDFQWSSMRVLEAPKP